MCRVGGRRCPGEHDPAVKAARNARRRAKYAADKASGKIKSKVKKKSTETVSNVDNSSTNKVETAKVINTIESRREHLGISATKNNLVEATDCDYQPFTISGKLNYKNLDNESYKDFGFEKPEEGWLDKERSTFNMSYLDTADITPTESHAVKLFTDELSGWVNELAYNPQFIDELPDAVETNENGYNSSYSAKDTYEKQKYVYDSSYSKELLKRTTDELDAAVSHGKKYQRIVYRGISYNEIQGDTKSWIDKNRSIGTEVVFDGYTSTTMKPNVVKGFIAGSTPVVYQILTPEGAAISRISSHMAEEEVILPRKQRYMVVGLHEDVPFANFSKKCYVVQMVAINSKGEILDGTNSDPIEPFINDEILKEN